MRAAGEHQCKTSVQQLRALCGKHTSEWEENASRHQETLEEKWNKNVASETTLIMKRGVHPVRKHNPLPPGHESIHHSVHHTVLYLFLTYYFIKEPECVFLQVVPVSAGAPQRRCFNAESGSS